ncbi:hypothetical protein B0H63DRAFT_477486 [Podospora didyma]|uniref:Uncharacterized protein n=1 Tax=Podospora didyma TaxID=330526 RepID=A0AAE0NB84_9PEZI|nr:hypothetical protein B0H63DRAFT_477486 [Podospora didyma]
MIRTAPRQRQQARPNHTTTVVADHVTKGPNGTVQHTTVWNEPAPPVNPDRFIVQHPEPGKQPHRHRQSNQQLDPRRMSLVTTSTGRPPARQSRGPSEQVVWFVDQSYQQRPPARHGPIPGQPHLGMQQPLPSTILRAQQQQQPRQVSTILLQQQWVAVPAPTSSSSSQRAPPPPYMVASSNHPVQISVEPVPMNYEVVRVVQHHQQQQKQRPKQQQQKKKKAPPPPPKGVDKLLHWFKSIPP